MSFNIAIDGPAGAGKSTIARQAAKELSFIYVDTGAMYRTIALSLLRRNIDIENEKELHAALDDMEISIGYADGEQQVYLNGENVSALIRSEEVGNMASLSSAIPQVRNKLTDIQRSMAANENVLMDGRDIGTVILPKAQLKIFLTASVSTRARRRFQEFQKKGIDCTLEEIEKEIAERDYRDMHRDTAPLCQAEDAVLVDSSEMTIDEVVGTIVLLAKERMHRSAANEVNSNRDNGAEE